MRPAGTIIRGKGTFDAEVAQERGCTGGAGGGATLGEMGAVAAGGFRAGQARIMLAAALATGTPVAEMFSKAPTSTAYTAG